MNLTFTKVRAELLCTDSRLTFPSPHPRLGGAIPHFSSSSRGNRAQSFWSYSLIRMRGMEVERREVSTSSVCFLSTSASSVQPKKGFGTS